MTDTLRSSARPVRTAALVCALAAGLGLGGAARAAIFDVTIDGGDAIFLAGRTDVVIPPASDPWAPTPPPAVPSGELQRHVAATPEEILESLPPIIPVAGGDVIRAADPAVGGVNFFNGFGPPFFGPDGNGVDGSDLVALDGISGYKGPEGPLAGVFLDDTVPSGGPAPATLDFTAGGMGTDFPTLTPLLGQVFYIGNGITSGGDFQTFIAPAGATRLALGIPDGFGFDGNPGAYDDNDGAYRVRIGVNEIPSLPEPMTALLAGAALLLAAAVAARRRVRRGDLRVGRVR